MGILLVQMDLLSSALVCIRQVYQGTPIWIFSIRDSFMRLFSMWIGKKLPYSPVHSRAGSLGIHWNRVKLWSKLSDMLVSLLWAVDFLVENVWFSAKHWLESHVFYRYFLLNFSQHMLRWFFLQPPLNMNFWPEIWYFSLGDTFLLLEN